MTNKKYTYKAEIFNNSLSLEKVEEFIEDF
jgi:hypothetical protein